MSESGKNYLNPRYSELRGWVAVNTQAGGYLVRPSSPSQRDVDMDRGTANWSPWGNRGGEFSFRSVWYRVAAIGASTAGVVTAAIIVSAVKR